TGPAPLDSRGSGLYITNRFDNLTVSQVPGTADAHPPRPPQYHLRRPGRPDAARDPLAPRGRPGHRDGAPGPGRAERAGGLEAPPRAGARRPGAAGPRGAVAAPHPRRGAAPGGGGMGRGVPAVLGRELRPAGRLPRTTQAGGLRWSPRLGPASRRMPRPAI